MSRLIPSAVAIVMIASAALAPAAPARVALWPDGAPGAHGQAETDQPWMDFYPAPAESATGCSVIICPGGGYGALAADHEGAHPAAFYNSIGVSAWVLHYRLGALGYRHPIPLQDAQRAVRLVRSRAAQDKADPSRIGVMGFSAGGHLAATVGTHFDAGNADAPDAVDRTGCRPDFLVLCYGVISFDPAITHGGSVRNLLGDQAKDPALLELLSNEKQVTAATPPAFLFHTTEDAAVPVENSLRFYEALRKVGTRAELHVYQAGPHGIGLMPGSPVLGTWPGHLHAWLRDNAWLAAAPVTRSPVTGTLTVNGAPVTWGSVTFSPLDPALPVTTVMVRRGQWKAGRDNGPVAAPSQISLTFSVMDVPGLMAPGGFLTTPSLTPGGPAVTLTPAPESGSVAWDLTWPAAP